MGRRLATAWLAAWVAWGAWPDGQAAAQDGVRRPLEAGPSAVVNPLKGLVPYAGEGRGRFPHALEFDYLPLGALVKGRGRHDWTRMEAMLDAIARRGHQAVFRIYLEYPGKADGIPAHLLAEGLKVHRYVNTNTAPLPPAKVETPDYEDPRLRATLREFVAALGARYDGDPRIGYVTAGLLGTWGEWHTYPREDLFASKAVQAEVMDAYAAAFRATPVLLRYPAGPGNPRMADNAARPFGYHDDSFAWATLHTGKRDEEWFFQSLLRAAGPAAIDKWKTQPVGGEIRPEAWGRVFDADPGMKEIQDFRRCVAETHATWLMDTGMFAKKPSAERHRRAEEEVRRMGYDFRVAAATVGPPRDGALPVAAELVNQGVAPLYHDWPAEWGLIAGGKVVRSVRVAGKLTGLLPGAAPRTWTGSLPLAGLPAGPAKVALRVPNRLPNGPPLRFANRAQDADLPGWLTLAEVRLP